LGLLAFSMILSPPTPRTDAAAAPATRPAPAGRIAYMPGKTVGEVVNEEIDESSGLACGRGAKNVLWTHNDSGDKPRIFAISHTGADLATVSITGASARDWEDMCAFAIGGRSFLMLADVGDNAAMRGGCTLYVVPEPRLNPRRRGGKLTVPVAMKINFKYSDGAHNCESTAVDTTSRTIYLVSKEKGPACKVYAMALPARSPKKIQIVRPVATLLIPTTTAMDISPDGLRAVVCTYGHAYEYVRRAEETWTHGFSRPPRKIALPYRSQGESICYGSDGKTLYLTSENLPVPLIKIAPKAPTTKPAKTSVSTGSPRN
jgi:hypothetical protein